MKTSCCALLKEIAMLAEPQPGPYDLCFRLFGTDVRVSPWFWLITLLFGGDLLKAGRLDLLVVWIACVFVSILVHEFGHALTGRLFGSQARIVLYGFGGLAVGSTQGLRRWQRVAVLFAGPGAGFLLLGLVLAVRPFLPPEEGFRLSPLGGAGLFLIEINLFWGLMNLLPVWPLDGGQISGELLSAWRRDGFRIALQISIVTGAAIAIWSFAENMRLVPVYVGLGLYGALLFAMLAYGSYQMLQQIPRDPWRDERYERTAWERDPDEWRR
jgi:stage IV sporulation protein FB